MSNTGRKKKLASFNCDQELWQSFMRRCQEQGTTATATLTRFISHYLDAEPNDLDAHLGKAGEGTDDQVNAICEQFLAERLPSYLDNYLTTHQGVQELQTTLATLSKKVEDLERRPSAAQQSRTGTSPKPPKEREFWFIPQRAKHLELKVNADLLIHVEMWAVDAFQKRHGRPPGRQLYRGVQSVVFPAADVDLLDAAIRGVVARASGTAPKAT